MEKTKTIFECLAIAQSVKKVGKHDVRNIDYRAARQFQLKYNNAID